MTDHELLELLVQKITRMDQRMNGMEQKMGGMEQQISGMNQKMSGMEQDVKLMNTQQSEHGQLLQSLIHAGETHKAQYDSLQIELAKLSGEVHQGFADQKEAVRALTDMYGQHELEINLLKRKIS